MKALYRENSNSIRRKGSAYPGSQNIDRSSGQSFYYDQLDHQMKTYIRIIHGGKYKLYTLHMKL